MNKLKFLLLLVTLAVIVQNQPLIASGDGLLSGVNARLDNIDDRHLPFSEGNITPEQAKVELESVYAAFNEWDEDCLINFKRITWNERLARVWWWNGKLIAAQWSDEELGANGTRTVFFDENGVVRAGVDNIHGNNWYREFWYYNNLDEQIFSFHTGAEITYDEDGIGHNPNEDKPLSSHLEETEEAPGISFEDSKDSASELYQLALEATDDRTGIYNYKGLFGFEVEFILQLDTDELNKITGKYSNGQQVIRLSGTLIQETFVLDEWDKDNRKLAEWHGRWVELDKIEGVIISNTGGKRKSFAMEPTNGSKF